MLIFYILAPLVLIFFIQIFYIGASETQKKRRRSRIEGSSVPVFIGVAFFGLVTALLAGGFLISTAHTDSPVEQRATVPLSTSQPSAAHEPTPIPKQSIPPESNRAPSPSKPKEPTPEQHPTVSEEYVRVFNCDVIPDWIAVPQNHSISYSTDDDLPVIMQGSNENRKPGRDAYGSGYDIVPGKPLSWFRPLPVCPSDLPYNFRYRFVKDP